MHIIICNCREPCVVKNFPFNSRKKKMYDRIAHSIGEYQETNPHAMNAGLLTGVQTGETDSVGMQSPRYEISVCHRSEFSRMDSVDFGFEGRAKGTGRRVSESPHCPKVQVESFWEEIWISGIYLLCYWTTQRPEAALRSNSTSNSHTTYFLC